MRNGEWNSSKVLPEIIALIKIRMHLKRKFYGKVAKKREKFGVETDKNDERFTSKEDRIK